MLDPNFVEKLAQAIWARMIPQIELVKNAFIGGDPNSRTGNKVLPRLLTVREAAAYIGRSVSALYKLVARREIGCVRHGRNLRFDRVELDRWIERDRV